MRVKPSQVTSSQVIDDKSRDVTSSNINCCQVLEGYFSTAKGLFGLFEVALGFPELV